MMSNRQTRTGQPATDPAVSCRA